MAWTEADTALLRKLWGEGLSASIIALRLGKKTRNTVIGKVHRLGFPPRRTSQRARHGASKRHLAAARVHQPRPEPAPLPPLPKPPLPVLVWPANPEPPPSVDITSVIALAAHHCRWPIGDLREPGFRFCCRQRGNGTAYCREHHLAAHLAAPQRKKPATPIAA